MRQGQPQNRQRSRGRGNNNNNRNNNNRNQLNRSMESNGPDVRIRGTAAHIAEKYMQLASDAQTSGDTVAAQSYWQFAEHYNRLIAIAQAAQQQQREEQEAKRGEIRQNRNEGARADADEQNDGQEEGRTRESKPRNPRSRSRVRKQDDEAVATADEQSSDDEASKKPSVKGEGPQPDVVDVPAEMALNDDLAVAASAQEVDAASDEKPKKVAKPRRTAKRPRKTEAQASVAEEANELPAFVTGAE